MKVELRLVCHHVKGGEGGERVHLRCHIKDDSQSVLFSLSLEQSCWDCCTADGHRPPILVWAQFSRPCWCCHGSKGCRRLLQIIRPYSVWCWRSWSAWLFLLQRGQFACPPTLLTCFYCTSSSKLHCTTGDFAGMNPLICACPAKLTALLAISQHCKLGNYLLLPSLQCTSPKYFYL